MSTTYAIPVESIRDGSLKATIWKTTNAAGDDYDVEITRTWHDDQGSVHDSESFNGSELGRIPQLAYIAYGRIAAHRANDSAARNN